MGRKGNGEGRWSKLPSGRFNWVRTYTAKNGTKARLSATGGTKTECRQAMKKKEEEFEVKSRMDFSTKGVLADNMEFWLLNVKKKDPHCGDTAFTRILSTFETHVRGSFLGNMREEQITDRDIVLFLSELKKHSPEGMELGDALSHSSKHKVYQLLNMYFNQKYIRATELNPMLTVQEPVKEERRTRKEGSAMVEDDDEDGACESVPLGSVWNDAEMEAIHEHCMKPYSHGVFGSVKRGPLIAFLLWTFMRSGELRALTWRDIHLEEGQEYASITKTWKKRGRKGDFEWVVGKPKSRKSIRNIELNAKAVEAIKEYRRRFPPCSEDDFVCLGDDGEILCESRMRRTLDSVLKGLGYDKIPGKNKTVHGLRHSGISFYIRKGVNRNVVSTLAGHSSTAVTEQVYTEIISEYCRDEIIRAGLAM